MHGSENKKQYLEELRKQAESSVNFGAEIDVPLAPEDIRAVIQDLRVYQAELELQNEELFRSQQLLENTKNEFASLYHQSPVGYATVDITGKVLQANQTFADLVERELGQIINLPMVTFIYAKDQPEFVGRFRAFYNKPDDKELSLRLKNKGGKVVVSVTGRRSVAARVGKEDDVPLLLAFSDISRIKQAEGDLRLISKVFDSSIEGIVITDAKGNIERVNKAFTIVTGYSESEIIGRNPALLQSGRHPASFYSDMWKTLLKEGHWQGEVINRRKNGENYIEWLSISSVRDVRGEVRHYIGIFTDITEKKLNSQQIQKLAYYDILTGLPNRTLFYDRLKQALVRAKRNATFLAVLFIDLDNFKELNDSHGHAAGDELLLQAAARLGASVRESDTLARMGGDEFTLILSDSDSLEQTVLEAEKVANKIQLTLSKGFDLDAVTYRVSASIGIAMYPQDGMVISDLVKHADTAMYQAKSAGKGQYQFYSKEVYDAQRERSALAEQFERALAEDEFVLYYQPQTRLTDDHVIGFEALIRWQHPENGLVPPDLFIPLAEQTGFINELGIWVLDTAMGQLKEWQQKGYTDWTVAVNISVEQIKDPTLGDRIKILLDKHQVDPEKIELEITETAMLDDAVKSANALKKIRELGFRVSLDDFGTGYSSMTYIKHFSVDVLKIDRTFVRDIFDSVEDRSIVLASLSLAKNLGIKTIAEGVETAEQKKFLTENGCDMMQGYLVSKPMPAADIDAFMDAQSAK